MMENSPFMDDYDSWASFTWAIPGMAQFWMPNSVDVPENT
jgi:ribonucleotide reductase beta subunit family protein with ferritin-like domain